MRIRTLAAAAILLTAACSQPAETAAPLAAAIAPTATAAPTAEPTTAPTPQPTTAPAPTPQPTATPQPTVNPIDELPALILEYQVALNDAISSNDFAAYLQISADHAWPNGTTPEAIECGIAQQGGTVWTSTQNNVSQGFHDISTLVPTPNWVIPQQAFNGGETPGDGTYAMVRTAGVSTSQMHVNYSDNHAWFFFVVC